MQEEIYSPIVQEKEMVKWNNPPKLSSLKQDLLEAKPYHDEKMQKISHWLDNLYIQGKAKVSAGDDRSSVVPKVIRKQAEWRYPSLSEPFLSTSDLFNAKPVTHLDTKAAYQNQVVLNNQFNTKIDKVKFINTYGRRAVNQGTVVVRTGWKAEYGMVDVEQPIIEQRFDPTSPTGYVEVQVGSQIVTEEKLIKNHPIVEVCKNQNVIIDPTCNGDLSKAQFVIYSFESDLSTLKKDSKYKNLDKINLDNNTILGTPDHVSSNEASKNFNFSDKPRKKFVVYEYWGYWDIDGSGIVKPFVAAWVGDTLIRLEESPYPDGELPFVAVTYLPLDDDSVYGEPDGALLEDNQKIIGAVTRGMIDIMGRSANGQIGIRKDALDVTNKRRFEQGKDYEFNPNVDPRQAIITHVYPEIPASAQFMLEMQNMEAESQTGVKAFSSGISGQSLGDVAASVRGALDAASKRELDILRRLSDGIIKIGRKIIAMNAEFLSEEEVVRITDEEFVTVRRDDLAGNFDLELSISTPEEDASRAQDLAFILQTIGPNVDFGFMKLILVELSRLKKMPELAKNIETYEPQPDPMQQKLQELELARLEYEIAELQAKTEKLRADTALSAAKVDTEAAKATQLRSQADLANLDFVEQESGVKQARDVEKIGEQARSQAALKVIEAKAKARFGGKKQ